MLMQDVPGCVLCSVEFVVVVGTIIFGSTVDDDVMIWWKMWAGFASGAMSQRPVVTASGVNAKRSNSLLFGVKSDLEATRTRLYFCVEMCLLTMTTIVCNYCHKEVDNWKR